MRDPDHIHVYDHGAEGPAVQTDATSRSGRGDPAGSPITLANDLEQVAGEIVERRGHRYAFDLAAALHDVAIDDRKATR